MNNIYSTRYFLFLNLLTLFIATSCTTSGPSGLFGKKSAHEDYGYKIKMAGLDETAMGRKWFKAAEQSIITPLSVTLPYSETGYFAADEPRAVGITFHALRGEKLTISLIKNPLERFALFLDLWEPSLAENPKPKLLFSADTSSTTTQYDVDRAGVYILRVQPELLSSGNYTLSLSIGPTLAFPVSPKAKSSVGSFWGAGRDAGARKHEGIDIFAPRGTAAVAAANGVVSRVEENRLGGQVVFMTPDNKDYTLYYAHLERQIARPGQRVSVGDTLGLVGNTGNAITTVPHLHFGIYTYQGAIDPLPFVNRVFKTPVKISAPLNTLGKCVRNTETVRLLNEPSTNPTSILSLQPNTLLKVQAATGEWYKVSLPGGEEGFVKSKPVIVADSPLKTVNLETSQPLFDQPTELAAKKTILTAGKTVSILASYKDYYFVKYENDDGWVSKKIF